MGIGAILPLLRSATGRVFLSFLPRVSTNELVKDERSITKSSPKDVDQIVSETQKAGFATISGGLIPGLYAMACPIFNIDGSLACCITFVSTDAGIFSGNNATVQLLASKITKANQIGSVAKFENIGLLAKL